MQDDGCYASTDMGWTGLPNWHWLYRDFVLASLNCKNPDDWSHRIQQDYLDVHVGLLNAIHFSPKGFPTIQEVMRRYEELGYRRFARMLNAIGTDFTKFEGRLISTANRLLEVLEYRGSEQDVYVIVGLDCTNIYSTQFRGSQITVLCLEATDGDFDALELLLSHECHHWRRQQQLNHDIFTSTVGERMVSEGLASYFSQEVQPGLDISDYCYVPPDTVEWVENNWSLLDTIHSDLNSNRFMSAFFSRTPNEQIVDGMPPRTGYVFGYIKVQKFLSDLQKNASQMSGIKWSAVMA